MVLIDESTTVASIVVFGCDTANCLCYHPGNRVKETNAAFDLCCRTASDLGSTSAGIQMHGAGALTAGQLLPLFLERKVFEISVRPDTAVPWHQIKEHYRNWMGRQTHDCSY